MSKVVNINSAKKNEKKHFQSESVSSQISWRLEIVLSKIHNCLSPWLTSFSWFSTKPIDSEYNYKIENAKEVLLVWKKEYNLNLTVRRNISQFISIEKYWIKISWIFWEITNIHEDFMVNASRRDNKGLNIPSVDDFEYCLTFMPWSTISEKRINFAKLLWFSNDQIEKGFKIWTNTKQQDTQESRNWIFDTMINFKNKIHDLIWKNSTYYNVLYISKDTATYFESPDDNIWFLIPIRKLK